MGLARSGRLAIVAAALLAASMFGASRSAPPKARKPVVRDYSLVRAAPAPRTQEWAEAEAKSAGCQSCHTDSDAQTMHRSPAVVLGCADCHGGNRAITRPEGAQPHDDPAYVARASRAHVLPRYPDAWHFPSSANPQRSYTLLNREAPEYRPLHQPVATIASSATAAAPAISR